MDQVNLQERFNKVISGFLANPADPPALDPAEVTALIEKYPFSQPLHLIRAVLTKTPEDVEKASFYGSQRALVQRFLHRPESISLSPVTYTRAEEQKQPDRKPEQKRVEVPEPENIAASDFFAFEKNTAPPEMIGTATEPEKEKAVPGKEKAEPEQEKAEPEQEKAEPEQGKAEPEQEKAKPEQGKAEPEKEMKTAPVENQDTGMSKYDDDKLPYTFLWWLSKTRSEHANTYQPYAVASASHPAPVAELKKNDANELNEQILESLYQLKNTVSEEDKDIKATLPQPKPKEDRIIDKFIREEPQIKPLQAEKIDTENKARKSSEDANDLVSETLAKIYADQMLYHKAADTYRKLRLKFPEKSAYFADQIKELERKV